VNYVESITKNQVIEKFRKFLIQIKRKGYIMVEFRIYVAGPYTKGDVVLNVRRSIEVAEEIVALGPEYSPYIPHLSHFWHLVAPHDYKFWLEYDKVWLRCCDALFRFPGISSGAEDEVNLAISLGIPVFYHIKDLKEYFNLYGSS
jgi:hypothetical protein